jgi:hypothetical protein
MANEAEEKLARGELTDHEAAEAVRDGLLPSPTKFGEFWLFALRVTGTGAAFRDQLEEYAYRHKELWTSPAFLERAASIPIIWGHPEKSGLTSDEYRERSIGNAVLSYVEGDSVWCVAKIFDADSAKLMENGSFRSTSPGVTPPKGAEATKLEGDEGKRILNEPLPLVLDHLAICEQGVWDAGGPPVGVKLSALIEEQSVTKEEEEKLAKERDDARSRADAAESKLKQYEDARKDAEAKAKKDAEEEKERADKSKRDAEETERQAVEKAEKEKADAKRDARKSRHDSEKHDGAHNDCSRCDAFEKGEVEDKKKDAAAAVETVNPEIDKLHDARRADSKRIEELAAEIAALKKQPTMDDANAIATAYHRYDSIYQMLGERVPQHMPGESPIAYRRRLADGLRKHTKTWKEHVLHDAVTGPAFDMLEDSIINEALAEAKNPTRTDANAGRLIERTTEQNGKTRTEFYGDSSVAFAPFEAPVMSFKFKKPSKAA